LPALLLLLVVVVIVVVVAAAAAAAAAAAVALTIEIVVLDYVQTCSRVHAASYSVGTGVLSYVK
jgi:hypothetical protein